MTWWLIVLCVIGGLVVLGFIGLVLVFFLGWLANKLENPNHKVKRTGGDY